MKHNGISTSNIQIQFLGQTIPTPNVFELNRFEGSSNRVIWFSGWFNFFILIVELEWKSNKSDINLMKSFKRYFDYNFWRDCMLCPHASLVRLETSNIYSLKFHQITLINHFTCLLCDLFPLIEIPSRIYFLIQWISTLICLLEFEIEFQECRLEHRNHRLFDNSGSNKRLRIELIKKKVVQCWVEGRKWRWWCDNGIEMRSIWLLGIFCFIFIEKNVGQQKRRKFYLKIAKHPHTMKNSNVKMLCRISEVQSTPKYASFTRKKCERKESRI